MKDIDITSLRLFATVCETGSIARAGTIHSTVPSAVSKRLSWLEAELGVPLTTRSRQGVIPTAAGQTLLEHARAVLLQMDRARRDMQAYRQGVRGKVRLLATVSSVAEFLPGDIAAFLQQPTHQDIQVDIEETLSRDMSRGIRAGLAPLGVCWNAADLEGLATRPYRQDHLCVVVHAEHPLAALQRCNFVDTLDHEHIGLPAGTAGYRLLQQAALSAGREIRYRALLSTFDAALKMVAAQLGVAVAPREIAAGPAAALGLRLVALEDPWAVRTFVLCFADETSLPPAAQLLMDFLASQVQGTSQR